MLLQSIISYSVIEKVACCELDNYLQGVDMDGMARRGLCGWKNVQLEVNVKY